MMLTTICRLTFDSRPAAGRSSGRKRCYPFRKVHNYGAWRTGVRWYDGYNRPGETDGSDQWSHYQMLCCTSGTLSPHSHDNVYSSSFIARASVCWWILQERHSTETSTSLVPLFLALPMLRSRAAQANLARLSKAYVDNRSLIQRVLSISFVLYVLGTTYHGFSGGTRGRVREGRGKASVQRKPGEESDRVAVCWHFIFYFVTNKALR